MKAHIKPLGAPVEDLRGNETFAELSRLAKAQGLAVFICNADQRAGQNHIHLKSNAITVGSFSRLDAAIKWLGGANG